MAGNATLLNIVDFMNVYGLIAIGTGLILGIFTQVSVVAGILLLALYYLSHPPFAGLKYGLPTEGSYLLVNKVLIEMVALIVVAYFPTGKYIGIDRLLFKQKTV